MTDSRIKLPEFVRLRAESHGEAGQRWMDGLVELIARFEQDWQIQAGDPLEGGTGGLVVPATQADGSPAILKIGMPEYNFKDELRTLQIADGRGYAKLLAYDKAHDAMLVEQLGVRLATLGYSTERQIEIICETLKVAWIPLDHAHGMMTGVEKAQWLADFIKEAWPQLGKPCNEATINLAQQFIEARKSAYDPANCVLVHGDAHEHNTLARDETNTRFKFVDPDGLFAEPAYDLAIPMREWSEELLAGDALTLGRARCALLNKLTGIDETAIWQWGFIERVSTGLTAIQIGMVEEGKAMLAVADIWANA
ncbi:MAG: aminoglycoside phosphotransferase family protein [Pseudomonadota bacterium]